MSNSNLWDQLDVLEKGAVLFSVLPYICEERERYSPRTRKKQQLILPSQIGLNVKNTAELEFKNLIDIF